MVSVIIPVYNAEQYIVECVESLLKQSLKDFELILIDDGSTDNSLGICKSFARWDNRVRWYHQANAGVSVARNRGIQEAKGEYICFVDSDDIVAPDFLEHLLSLAKDGAFAICGYTRCIHMLGSDLGTIKRYESKDFIIRVFDESIIHPNICMMLFKTSIIHKNSLLFTPKCTINEDTEFYIKYATFEEYIAVSDYKGYFYRDNPHSAMHTLNRTLLTAIDASQRISDFLVEKGFGDSVNMIVPLTIESNVYRAAKHRNVEVYNLIHSLYDVNAAMKKMIRHHRIARKVLSIIYLCLGKQLFFKIISMTNSRLK